MTGPISLQWTLSQTTDNFLKVGRDLVRVASTDNVQPITLLACSRFGATLAISPTTRAKIQVLLKSQADPVMLKFLKAQVGYVKGDSADLLTETLAGVNLLALAAALIATSSTFEAGSALEIMILATAADKTLVPTSHHLKDLLDILEPRLNRAGFLSEVLGWKDWWAKNGGEMTVGWSDLTHQGELYPSPEGIHHIVAAFREVARIGDAVSIVFTVGLCAPWLTAFTKWCLGLPPTVYNQQGAVILEQPESFVTILNSGDLKYVRDIKIEILREYSSMTEVVYAAVFAKDQSLAGQDIARGMVELPVFARQSVRQHHLHGSLGNRALLQALPYALKQVRDRCICGEQCDSNSVLKSLHVSQFEPFPDEAKISDAMAKYLSLEKPVHLKKLDEGILVSDLPLVRLWDEAQDSTLQDTSRSLFINHLSYIVADILALSLFSNSLDHLMLYYSGYDRPPQVASEWFDCINKILLKDCSQRCSAAGILAWALQLIGHETCSDLQSGDWVGTSFRGQVVFPEIFEAQFLVSKGFLSLVCIPGVLIPGSGNTRRFSRINSLPARFTSSAQTFGTDAVTKCSNLFRTEKVVWQTSIADHCLQVGIGWSKSLTRIKPFDLLQGLSYATLLKSCPHACDAEMADCGTEVRFLLPGENVFIAARFSTDDCIGVYPVFEDQALRILSVSSVVHTRKEESLKNCKSVVNYRACLTCLVKTCHLLQGHHIIC